ncbi:MAG: hypothetical protein V1861_02800 [Candidatus Micrarchaeota archaeon]
MLRDLTPSEAIATLTTDMTVMDFIRRKIEAIVAKLPISEADRERIVKDVFSAYLSRSPQTTLLELISRKVSEFGLEMPLMAPNQHSPLAPEDRTADDACADCDALSEIRRIIEEYPPVLANSSEPQNVLIFESSSPEEDTMLVISYGGCNMVFYPEPELFMISLRSDQRNRPTTEEVQKAKEDLRLLATMDVRVADFIKRYPTILSSDARVSDDAPRNVRVDNIRDEMTLEYLRYSIGYNGKKKEFFSTDGHGVRVPPGEEQIRKFTEDILIQAQWRGMARAFLDSHPELHPK